MAAEVKLEREDYLMNKLPPVRKRKTYQDIGENDLVAALFYDRIADELDPDKREQRDEQEPPNALSLRESLTPCDHA